MSNLGERIIKLRKERKMSQTTLAKEVGISYAQIGRYETKDKQPPVEVLKRNLLQRNEGLQGLERDFF